jgi:spore germination protein GerM
MRWILVATSLAATIVAGACGGTVTPSPSPSPTTTTPNERVQIFYARADEPPLAAPLEIKAGLTIDQRVQARFTWLAAGPWSGPGSSFNVLRGTARVGAVAIHGDLANLDFTVSEDGWGVNDSATLRAFLEQVVYTATDEKSVYRVKLTQNGGEDAEIATSSAIVTYRSPLTREIVTPFARQDHTVVYFARDLRLPVAVFLEGAGTGASPEERIRSRLVALENGPARVEPDAFNVVATMRARLRSVTISGDLVTIDYRVRDDDWGVSGSASLLALVQQLVFTASEEPGIVRVMITQNGEAGALIGGEGLVIDHPQTRRDLLGW